MVYYIEITTDNGEIIAGELEQEMELAYMELVNLIAQFAVDNSICPSWALSNCKYKIK